MNVITTELFKLIITIGLIPLAGLLILSKVINNFIDEQFKKLFEF
jgi:hypothetical protein